MAGGAPSTSTAAVLLLMALLVTMLPLGTHAVHCVQRSAVTADATADDEQVVVELAISGGLGHDGWPGTAHTAAADAPARQLLPRGTVASHQVRSCSPPMMQIPSPALLLNAHKASVSIGLLLLTWQRGSRRWARNPQGPAQGRWQRWWSHAEHRRGRTRPWRARVHGARPRRSSAQSWLSGKPFRARGTNSWIRWWECPADRLMQAAGMPVLLGAGRWCKGLGLGGALTRVESPNFQVLGGRRIEVLSERRPGRTTHRSP